MADDIVATIALGIFTTIRKAEGSSKSAAESEWRLLGPDGRSKWRDAAKVAIALGAVPQRTAPTPLSALLHDPRYRPRR